MITPPEYAAAFMKTHERSPERLFRALARRGEWRRAKRIVREIVQSLVRERGGHLLTFAYARVPNTDPMNQCMGPHDYAETVIDPSLIAGVRITQDGEKECDMSFARILRTLL